MYNSLSNIQKHLYSLIKQNNPEYLQQSINEEVSERRRSPNLADVKAGERLADFEGLDQQHADELRYRRKESQKMRDRNAGYKLDKDGNAEIDQATGEKIEDPILIKRYKEKDRIKDENNATYYNTRFADIGRKAQAGEEITDKDRADVVMYGIMAKGNAFLDKNVIHVPAIENDVTTTVNNSSSSRRSNSNQRISPTYWVTHGDFETATGEKYDVMNAKHRQLFFDLNSSGESTVAPTAGVGEGPAYDSQAYHTMRRRPANVPKYGTPQARYDTVDGTIANTTPQSRARAQQSANDRDAEIRAEARRIVDGEQQTSTSTQSQQRYPVQGQQRYPVQNQTGNSDIGIDITQQSPDQIAAMNDPSRGGQSGRFGKPSQRAINNLDIRSEYYNDGGMQNANQAMDLTGKSVNSKISRIA